MENDAKAVIFKKNEVEKVKGWGKHEPKEQHYKLNVIQQDVLLGRDIAAVLLVSDIALFLLLIVDDDDDDVLVDDEFMLLLVVLV